MNKEKKGKRMKISKKLSYCVDCFPPCKNQLLPKTLIFRKFEYDFDIDPACCYLQKNHKLW